MKTKDLIKELQELDPSGELQVDGILEVDLLPGYWDGPCYYKDEDGNFVIDYNNEKIVLYHLYFDDFFWNNDKSKLKVLDEVHIGVKTEKDYYDMIEEIHKQKKEFKQDSLQRQLPEILNKLKKGYVIIKHKDAEKYFFTWIDKEIINPNMKLDNEVLLRKSYSKNYNHLNQGEAQIIADSGYFKTISTHNKYEIWSIAL